MPRYQVLGYVTISAYTYVEASTPEEAKRLAQGRTVSLCPHGPEREGVNPWEEAIAEYGDGELNPTEAEPTTNNPEDYE